MKKHLLILSITMISATFTFAQQFKPNSKIRANKVTFKIDEVKQQGIASNSISVKNVNNIYYNRIPKGSALDLSSLYLKIEKGSMLKAFTQVFSDDRLEELTSEHILNLSLYIAPSGKVLEVDFLLRKSTMLTAIELEQLENSIKSNVYFKLTPEETKSADFFKIGLAVKYQNVLDRIER